MKLVMAVTLLAGIGLATPVVLHKRSSCQLGSIGPANAGNAACSASVSRLGSVRRNDV